MKLSDTIRVALSHIRETIVFFYANVIAITVGVLLVVLMLSMSVGLSRYVGSLMKSDVSAEMIEVTLDAGATGAPITSDVVQRFETVPYVESITPAVSSVFAELRAGKREAFISLASPERTDGAQASSLPYRRLPGGGQDAGGAAGWKPPLLIPTSVARELGLRPNSLALLHLTRSGGEVLEIPVTIGTIKPSTRFSRCYAPLSLMRRIRTWQDSRQSVVDVFSASDDNTAFVYDTALVYARSVGDVPAVRAELEKLGYRTASILDSVKRYRQILLIASVTLTSLGLIALFTGSVSIFNAAYAAVMRRTRELAIYKTYGATRRMIISIVLTEALITAIVSGILGFAAGGAVCVLLQRLVRGEVDSVLFPIEWWLMLVALATACIATLAASALPALRAARLSPTEAMRG